MQGIDYWEHVVISITSPSVPDRYFKYMSGLMRKSSSWWKEKLKNMAVYEG